MAFHEYIMALDYGDKRVGVALTHVVARLPQPYTTLKNTDSLLTDIQALVQKENVGLVVVGLPRGMDGGYTEQTRKAEAFAKALAEAVNIPVELTDETLTSVDAESRIGGAPRDKGEIDALAASLILERYLAAHPARGEAHDV